MDLEFELNYIETKHPVSFVLRRTVNAHYLIMDRNSSLSILTKHATLQVSKVLGRSSQRHEVATIHAIPFSVNTKTSW